MRGSRVGLGGPQGAKRPAPPQPEPPSTCSSAERERRYDVADLERFDSDHG